MTTRTAADDHLARHPRPARPQAVDHVRAREAGAAQPRVVLAPRRTQALRRAEAPRRRRPGDRDEQHTGNRPRTVYAITAAGPAGAASVARRASRAAVARVRGDGQGVLRRRGHPGATADDARRVEDCNRAARRLRAMIDGPRRGVRTSSPAVAGQRARVAVPARPRSPVRVVGAMGPRTDRRVAVDDRGRRLELDAGTRRCECPRPEMTFGDRTSC